MLPSSRTVLTDTPSNDILPAIWAPFSPVQVIHKIHNHTHFDQARGALNGSQMCVSLCSLHTTSHCSAPPPLAQNEGLFHSSTPPRQNLLSFTFLTCFLFSKTLPLEAHLSRLALYLGGYFEQGHSEGTAAMLVSLLPSLAGAWDTLPTETPRLPAFCSFRSSLNLAFFSRPTPTDGRAVLPDSPPPPYSPFPLPPGSRFFLPCPSFSFFIALITSYNFMQFYLFILFAVYFSLLAYKLLESRVFVLFINVCQILCLCMTLGRSLISCNHRFLSISLYLSSLNPGGLK